MILFFKGKCVKYQGQMCHISMANVSKLSRANVLMASDTQSHGLSAEGRKPEVKADLKATLPTPVEVGTHWGKGHRAPIFPVLLY